MGESNGLNLFCIGFTSIETQIAYSQHIAGAAG